jgi:DNA-binding transcriptional regulator YiaG
MNTTAQQDWPVILKAIRKQFSLTQDRAAKLIGVSARSWVAWEQGYRVPTPSARILIHQLAGRLKTDPVGT